MPDCDWCGEPLDSEFHEKECVGPSEPTMNDLCDDRETRKCLRCLKRWDCLDGNWNHRVKRAEMLDTIGPGEFVVVDNIIYNQPKQACLNCKNLRFHNNLFCTKIQAVIIDILNTGCDGKPGVGECRNCNKDKFKIRPKCEALKCFIKDIESDKSDCETWKFGIGDD